MRYRALLLAAVVLLLGASLPPLASAQPPDRPAADEAAPSATPAQLAALQAILARPEFRAAEGRGALDRLLDPARSALRWLAGELLRWTARAVRAGGDAVPIGLAIAGVVGLAVVGLLVRRLLRGAVVANAAIQASQEAGPPRAADERARARALAAAGAYRQAIHHEYRAVLLWLDERDHLAFDGALTNRELLPRLTAAPALAGPFAALVDRFDRLWYGQADCSREEAAAFAALAAQVWRAAETVPVSRSHRPGPVGSGAGGGAVPEHAAGAAAPTGGTP